MRKTYLVFTILIGLFLLSSFAPAQVHPAVYSNASLKGPYGFLTNTWLSNQSDYPCAELGILNFDGAGNFTIAFTENCGGSVNSYTGGGTYSVAKDGTGSFTGTLSGISGTFTEAIVLNSGGKGFQMVLTSCPFCGNDTDDDAGTAIAMGATSFSNASLKGSYEFMSAKLTYAQDENASINLGAGTCDGAGKIKGSGINVFAGTPQSFTYTGTYSVNSDGSGSMTITTPDGSWVTSAFVINSASSTGLGAKGLQTLKTAESSGSMSVESGTATKQ